MQDKPGARHPLRVPGDIARMALAAFGVIAVSATVIAVTESYANLLAFALAYGLSGWRAAIAPGAVDSFIVMGELLLFAAVILAWPGTLHVFGGAMAGWGFLLSVGGNVWHAASATAADRAVSAIWPVTATAGLAGILLIVRQAMAASRATPPPVLPRSPGKSRQAVTRREASRPAGPVAARDDTEQAVLERLLASPGPLPSHRRLSREEFGMERSHAARRVLDEARAQMNGNGHD